MNALSNKLAAVVKIRFRLIGWRSLASILLMAITFGLCLTTPLVNAIAPNPGPGSGSVGLEGRISAPPPKQGATISSPGNGASFSAVPITVTGLCPKDLLVKLFSNNVFVGSVICSNGSYTLQINLFGGKNELVARVFDALDQPGPDSNIVTVTYVDAQIIQFGASINLSSDFARKGADPGQVLEWPIILTGGTGPFAISIDWGDGSPPDLLTQTFAGNFNIKHTYKAAGIYKVIVKATDTKGSTAFLQLVGVANGKVNNSGSSSGNNSNAATTRMKIIWWPMLLLLPLIPLAFWAGQKNELFAIRKQLERTRDAKV